MPELTLTQRKRLSAQRARAKKRGERGYPPITDNLKANVPLDDLIKWLEEQSEPTPSQINLLAQSKVKLANRQASKLKKSRKYQAKKKGKVYIEPQKIYKYYSDAQLWTAYLNSIKNELDNRSQDSWDISLEMIRRTDDRCDIELVQAMEIERMSWKV